MVPLTPIPLSLTLTPISRSLPLPLNSDPLSIPNSNLILTVGVLVPGGFGIRGIEGKVQAVKYARENQVRKALTQGWGGSEE